MAGSPYGLMRAIMFPGQGSQWVGMGKDLYSASKASKYLFDEADEVLGRNITRVMFDGPKNELNDTENTQPAILTHSMALLAALQSQGISLQDSARFLLGHSLGQYTALVAADCISFKDAVALVALRGRLMKSSLSSKETYKMAAVLMPAEQAQRVVEAVEHFGMVDVANFNSDEQIVLSGRAEAVDEEVRRLKGSGLIHRAVPLPSDVPFHSRCLRGAEDLFRKSLESISIRVPRVPIVSNLSAEEVGGPDEIRRELVSHLTSPVQWSNSIRYLVNHGVNQFLELGPSRPLSSLLRRQIPGVNVVSISSYVDLNDFLIRNARHS